MYLNSLSDKELIRRYVNGNENALKTLIDRYKSKIYSYIMMLVKNRQMADDIFQDTFIKVINSFKSGKYTEEGKFMPWVKRIAHNIFIDNYRKAKHKPIIQSKEGFNMVDIIHNGDITKEQEMIIKCVEEKLTMLVDLLSYEQKEVLKMRIYKRMSFKEISEETGVSINTALGRMRYALINLRKLIDEKKVDLSISY